MIKPIWIKSSLFFFFIVSIIGTSLRAIYFLKLPFDYAHLVHAHSHVAFQGWIYIVLFVLCTNLFLTKKQIEKGHYLLQLKLTLFIIFGILVSFSLQGYGVYSIIFSTLFQFMNYWFIFCFFKDLKQPSLQYKNSISVLFLKTGLWLAVLSTLMPWGVGILSAKGMSDTEAYQSFIYSFLHFQYNGWFLFVCFALFLKWLEIDNIAPNKKLMLNFYRCLILAIFPALTLSLLGMSFRKSLIIPAHLAGIFQIIGGVFLCMALKPFFKNWIFKKAFWIRILIITFLFSFFLKLTFQYLSVFQIFKDFAFHNKHTVLAYLHLSLIGVISVFILAFLFDLKWLNLHRFSQGGILLLFSGFIVTEMVLLLGAFSVWYSYRILFYGSACMALGIFLLLLSPQKMKDE
ncbi:hypothetical protein [Namhaeicola litoreus]|uniref:NnrS family protein n=1 Tax=Namhaeicola litoreus TaxID=1052145 RepID=A0ABW3XZP9_9FLAO